MGGPNVFAEGSYHEALPVVRRQVEQFEAACVAYGRDPGAVRRLLVEPEHQWRAGVEGRSSTRPAGSDRSGSADLVVQSTASRRALPGER